MDNPGKTTVGAGDKMPRTKDDVLFTDLSPDAASRFGVERLARGQGRLLGGRQAANVRRTRHHLRARPMSREAERAGRPSPGLRPACAGCVSREAAWPLTRRTGMRRGGVAQPGLMATKFLLERGHPRCCARLRAPLGGGLQRAARAWNEGRPLAQANAPAQVAGRADERAAAISSNAHGGAALVTARAKRATSRCESLPSRWKQPLRASEGRAAADV